MRLAPQTHQMSQACRSVCVCVCVFFFFVCVCVCVCVCVSKSVSKIHDQQVMHVPLTCHDSPLNTECF